MTVEELQEPLLAKESSEGSTLEAPANESENLDTTAPLSDSEAISAAGSNGNANNSDDDDATNDTSSDGFNLLNEIVEMANLGVPLAVSFFCRSTFLSSCRLIL